MAAAFKAVPSVEKAGHRGSFSSDDDDDDDDNDNDDDGASNGSSSSGGAGAGTAGGSGSGSGAGGGGGWLAVLGRLLSGAAWSSWRAQITFAIVRLLFALSAAPFAIFAVGPLHKLFSHTDPTAYTPTGKLVQSDPNGLSNYLAWLKADVLGSRALAPDLEDLPPSDVVKLRKAVQQAEQALADAWQRPHSAKAVMARKKAELDALLGAIVTRERASDALYTTCFPDKVLVDALRRKRAKEERQTERKTK